LRSTSSEGLADAWRRYMIGWIEQRRRLKKPESEIGWIAAII
jgi:hypothetical protein